MLFNIVDFNDTITKITSIIDANCEKASVTRREIEKLKKQNVNNDEERKLEIFETDEIDQVTSLRPGCRYNARFLRRADCPSETG